MNVASQLDFLIEGLSTRTTAPKWPPDVFAVAAQLLYTTGGYCSITTGWPPTGSASDWAVNVVRVGEAWRKSFQRRVPPEVQESWRQVMLRCQTPISQACADQQFCGHLISLVAYADEACNGVGVPLNHSRADSFDFEAVSQLELNGGSSLCKEIDFSALRVLPKMHTPQSGLTIRSFSHHLALCSSTEIKPIWRTVSSPEKRKNMNLLVVPWPTLLDGSNFKVVPRDKSAIQNLPISFELFEFQHDNPQDFVDKFLHDFEKIRKSATHIDAVIFPECSVSESEYKKISISLSAVGTSLIAGISGARTNSGSMENYLRYNIPLSAYQVPIKQSKHHRWKLESRQIGMYGLNLDKEKRFWEHITVGDRTLHFVCLRPWLTTCVLICEDLARPDPVGDLIRAVGPNLVIALLLDGPQLEKRWPGRYAAALTDDPGSSVLTVSCLGMTRLSRRPSEPDPDMNTRTIGLWKDVDKACEIDAKTGNTVLLGVEVVEREEWSADGRSDGGASGYPILKTITIFDQGKKVEKRNV